MKKLLFSLAIALLAITTSFADNVAVTVPANTSSNIISTPLICDTMTFTATSANVTTIKLFDSSTTSTNVILGAYTSYRSYTTNYSVTFTNESNVLVTNTFAGVYTGPVSNAQSTNTMPVLMTVIVPASGQRTKITQLQCVRGLTAVGNQAFIIEVDYRKNP